MQLFVGLGLVMLAEDPAVRVRLQLALDLMREERHLPGVVLGVALDEGGSFALASGISDRARQVPMTADLLLLQGSVGKTYVAATALQLVHEGSLDLDTRIGLQRRPRRDDRIHPHERGRSSGGGTGAAGDSVLHHLASAELQRALAVHRRVIGAAEATPYVGAAAVRTDRV
jgi:hypothetical protein